jgi:succinate dehydrogenase / fumarate reductase iron-sulfur subunit
MLNETTYRFRIARAERDGTGRRADAFEVALASRMTVLDGLTEIQHAHDASLSFRCSCRVGMCGTCAMEINGAPRLACQTRVETLATETVTVAPLRNLPVLKDLIVSLEPFFSAWKRIRPALHPVAPDSQELAVVRPDSDFGRQSRGKRDCLTCGACFAACGIKGMNAQYLGPAAINRALLRLLDPRDGAVDERLAALDDERGGVWRCHTQFNCVAACPKGIALTDSIGVLKRALLQPRRFYEKLAPAKRAQV